MKWIIVPILVALLLILVVSNIVIVQQSRLWWSGWARSAPFGMWACI